MIVFFLSVIKEDGSPFPAKVIRANYAEGVAMVDPDPPLGCKILRTYVDRTNPRYELSTTVVVEDMVVM